MYQNIPYELQQLHQWCVWRYEKTDTGKATKIPYTALGYNLSVTNAFNYMSFEKACELAATGQYNGIGIVLTDNDPYCVIDLDHSDDEQIISSQRQIVATFNNTYSEYSPSGLGLHIICKAVVPVGRKRTGIEIYSSKRFITMTGKTFNHSNVTDCQTKVLGLYNKIGKAINETLINEQLQVMSDEDLLLMASKANNGGFFDDLWAGRWQDYYKSQSEADFALINILGFYSRNREQIVRLFRQSALARREKARRDDYVLKMVNVSFDNQPPPIDFTHLAENMKKYVSEKDKKEGVSLIGVKILTLAEMYPDEIVKIEQTPLPTINSQVDTYGLNLDKVFQDIPDGLVKEMAKFFYAQAARPAAKIAMISALGLMAGVCGRAYNVSATGLNNYFVLLARTGTGKEAINDGITKLINSVKAQQPQVVNFLGLNELVSGVALLRYLAEENNSFLSIQGEFGLTLKKMSSNTAHANMQQLRRVILDLYHKSGYGKLVQSTHYADSARKISEIESPAFSILGESTGEKFYEALNDGLVEEGLISRLTIVEYTGQRVNMNKAHAEIKPSDELKQHFLTLCSNTLTLNASNRVINVGLTPEADKLMDVFDCELTAYINAASFDMIAQLWNRGHLKALKIAALFAIGQNYYQPVITKKLAEWAIAFVRETTQNLIEKYRSGNIGMGVSEDAQVFALKEAIQDYITRESKVAKTNIMRSAGVFSFNEIYNKCKNIKCFKSSLIGGKLAIEKTLLVLVDLGYLEKIKKHEMQAKFNVRCEGYALMDIDFFTLN